MLESCLTDPEVTPELKCQRQWLPAGVEIFRRKLFPVLEKRACESSAIAGGLIRQIDARDTTFALDTTNGRFGLAGRFAALLDKRECKGLSSLSEREKDGIRDLAKEEEEERRRQSGAGKPTGEVPAPPTPPPAAAPETP